MSKGAWVSMLPGNLREVLGPFVEGCAGPENVMGYERPDGTVYKVRSEWVRPDGTRRGLEYTINKRNWKISTFRPSAA